MTITVDHEKMLRSLLDDDFVPTGPLAVPAQVNVVLRKHPEAGELLAHLAAQLVHGIDQFDRSRGGAGVEYDPKGSTETATELKLRLYLNLHPNQMNDPFGRMDTIHQMLNDLAATARTEVVATQDADLRARVAAELESPIPRSVAARLVTTSTSSRT